MPPWPCAPSKIVHASAEGLCSSLWSHGMRGALEQVEATAGAAGMRGALEQVEATAGAAGVQRRKIAVLAQATALRQSDGIHQVLPVRLATAIKDKND